LPLKVAIVILGEIFSILIRADDANGLRSSPTPPTELLDKFFQQDVVISNHPDPTS